MDSVDLGGLTVSRLGFGGCPLGGHGWGRVDERRSLEAVRAAHAGGVTMFDTADVYGLGRSEELLSQALGDAREDVVIATKFGVRRTADGRTVRDIRPRYLRQALEASLRRLRVECVPLYYVHWPDGSTPIEDAVGELERCRTEGKIRAIGLSNCSAEEVERARRVAPIAALQTQYSLVEVEEAERLLSGLETDSPLLVTWGSLAQGLLSGKFDEHTTFADDDRRSRYPNFQGERFARCLRLVDRLRGVAQRLDRSPAQVAMRWLLDTPGVACTLFGAKDPQQVEENLASQGWRLPAEAHASLTAAAASLSRPQPLAA